MSGVVLIVIPLVPASLAPPFTRLPRSALEPLPLTRLSRDDGRPAAVCLARRPRPVPDGQAAPLGRQATAGRDARPGPGPPWLPRFAVCAWRGGSGDRGTADVSAGYGGVGAPAAAQRPWAWRWEQGWRWRVPHAPPPGRVSAARQRGGGAVVRPVPRRVVVSLCRRLVVPALLTAFPDVYVPAQGVQGRGGVTGLADDVLGPFFFALDRLLKA